MSLISFRKSQNSTCSVGMYQQSQSKESTIGLHVNTVYTYQYQGKLSPVRRSRRVTIADVDGIELGACRSGRGWLLDGLAESVDEGSGGRGKGDLSVTGDSGSAVGKGT